jgi:predicted DCC family thiol-disulfide oxidoreductase YuxK
MSSVLTEFSDSSAADFRGWLFYDAGCSFCSRSARWLEPFLLARGIHCAALQDPWVASLVGLSRPELLSAVRVWTPDGRQFTGADAVVFLARHFAWTRPLAAMARFAPLMRLLRSGYAWVAQRRHCIHAPARLVRASGSGGAR